MLKHVATCVFVVTFFLAMITPVFGHGQQWILPNFFYTNRESPWLGIEHTWGDPTVCLWTGARNPFIESSIRKDGVSDQHLLILVRRGLLRRWS